MDGQEAQDTDHQLSRVGGTGKQCAQRRREGRMPREETHNERGRDTEQAGVDSRMKNGCWIATTNNCPTRRGDAGGLPFDGKTVDLTEHH